MPGQVLKTVENVGGMPQDALMGIFGNKGKTVKTIVLDSDFFIALYEVVDQMPGEMIEDKRIAYAGRENRQYIEVVGESFCQDDLRNFYKPEKWRYGFLAPEQANPYDSNAVAIYLISTDEENGTDEFSAYRVGYLKKEVAKKVSGSIAQLLVQKNIVIPVLAIVKEADRMDDLAVVAYAMTDVINF
jgi:hypothetical protein